ncbi:MAG: hypothetical protein IKC03_06365 [Oscillospiraceae bacterium]|nr:hypothetical protein [Oscillospiraceae bacterium]
MKWIISVVVIAVLIAIFLTWRFRVCLRRREPLGQDSTWVLYIAPVLIYDMLGDIFPGISQPVQLGILAGFFVLSWFATRAVTRMYDQRLEKLLEDEPETMY